MNTQIQNQDKKQGTPLETTRNEIMRKFLEDIIEKFATARTISFAEAVNLLKNTQGRKFLTDNWETLIAENTGQTLHMLDLACSGKPELAKHKGKTSPEQNERIDFICHALDHFAISFKMTQADAYQFLDKWQGLNYLFANWEQLRTEPKFQVSKNLMQVCLRAGGPKQ